MRMKTGSEPAQKFTTFEEVTNLSWADKAESTRLLDALRNEQMLFGELSRTDKPDLIIKLASLNSQFENFCKRPQCIPIWAKFYPALGYALSMAEKESVNFLAHNSCHSFDLLRGAYFFYFSQLVREELQIKSPSEYNYTELLFLKEAMKYNSIHATQRYNDYLYLPAHTEKLSFESKKAIHREIILNCKKLLETYGSYAYMMLAEAFFHLGELYYEAGKYDAGISTIYSAIKATEKAEEYLELSKYSIHNASIGKGLKKSNTLNTSNPTEAKIYLMNWLNKPHQKPNTPG